MSNTEQFELGNKVAVVTGGTEGIGYAIAEILGRAGARVVVTSRRAEAVAATATKFRDQGIEALGVATDVRDTEAVSNLMSSAVEKFGGVDILVNTAGGSFGDSFTRGPLLGLEANDFLESYRLNVVGAFLCAGAAVPIMREGGGGCIVNISSLASHDPAQGMAAYGASKAALNNLTRSMAKEWAPEVRVNAVAPGHIDTPRTSANRSPERVAVQVAEIGLGRFGMPEDVANGVLYLVSPAGAWLTGVVLDVDGGHMLA
jgi:NAD(P)-dependent dehydrogenase (short-subunit alcohol dehydrogenase family)